MIDGAEVAGTAVFAASGVIAVSRRELDWFGAIVVGVVTAVGGGTMRGLILGKTPVFWVDDTRYLMVAVAGALAAIPIAHYLARGSPKGFESMLKLSDAAGLALFAVVGASLTFEAGFGAPVAVVGGLLTGVGGGIIRDVLAGQTPLVMRGEIYATAALAGVLIYAVLHEPLAVAEAPSAALGMATIFTVRMVAVRRGWTLPSF